MQFQSNIQYGFLGIIFFLLIIPATVGFFQPNGNDASEQRQKAAKPSYSLKNFVSGAYQDAYEQYLNDHFGLRDMMVRETTKLYVHWFASSPLQKVIVGGNRDWLFVNSGDLSFDTTGIDQYSFEQQQGLEYVFTQREQYFSELGIPYVYIVVPNKQTVYPEYLPFDVDNQVQTKTDQLINIVQEHTDIPVIDLRPVLIEAKSKSEYPLYIQTDTHWQPYGAYIAYQYVFDELKVLYPELFSDLNYPERTIESHAVQGGDLSRMLGLLQDYQESFVVMLLKEGEEMAKKVENPYTELTSAQIDIYEQVDSSNKPNAVIYRDSFGDALTAFVSEQFDRTVFIWDPHIKKEIQKQEQPDIVLQFMVERLAPDLLKTEQK